MLCVLKMNLNGKLDKYVDKVNLVRKFASASKAKCEKHEQENTQTEKYTYIHKYVCACMYICTYIWVIC